MEDVVMDSGFWRDRRVLVTGHTGFKGGWLCLALEDAGAKVSGLALSPPSRPNLFEAARVAEGMDSALADVRDPVAVQRCITGCKPEIVFHLAAQSLVRQSYEEPALTFETNVMGTVNLLEACRMSRHVRAIVVVTSDKCYENPEDGTAFSEADRLGAGDPYSTSKACAELVAASYRTSFGAIGSGAAAIATVRAGNVIGGGDWSRDRLLPDLVAAFSASRAARVRRPDSVRPWQHVMDPVSGYLKVAERLFLEPSRHARAWNFGPGAGGCARVSDVASIAATAWGKPATWEAVGDDGPREATMLRLDSSLATGMLGWRARWDVAEAVKRTIEWQRGFLGGVDPRELTLAQIRAYRGVGAGKHEETEAR